MTQNLIPLPVQVGNLDDAPSGETRQQFAEELARKLLVQFPSEDSTFRIGGSEPTSDEGPWFKEGIDQNGDATYFLYIWGADSASYVPLTLEQQQLRYFVGATTPSEVKYDVWFEVSTDGRLLSIRTFDSNTNEWVNVYYRRDEIDSLFEPTVDGKKQVAWPNVITKPDHVSNAPRASSEPGATLQPNYNFEIVYHTGIGQLIVFVPGSNWITLDGGSGDTKTVKHTSLGSSGDFDSGNFGSALGRNPGWVWDTSSQGRSVVGAAPGETWNSLTAAEKTAGSSFGDDQHLLTADETRRELIQIRLTASTNGSNNADPVAQYAATGIMVGDTGANTGNLSLQAAHTPDAHNNVQKSIAYWRLVKG